MRQQASLTKLKEQIEAAKRSLSEMPVVDGTNVVADEATSNINAHFSSRENVALINNQPINTPKISNPTIVDLPTSVEMEAAKVSEISFRKTAIDKGEADQHYSSNSNKPFEDFHLFHRKKKPENPPLKELNNQTDVNSDTNLEIDASDCLFNEFDIRLKTIETNVAQNCLHIDELIKISSGISSFQSPASLPKSKRRLVRRYVFWLVIWCLAIGWFALTPSGHVGINYLLSLN